MTNGPLRGNLGNRAGYLDIKANYVFSALYNSIYSDQGISQQGCPGVT